MEMICPDKKCVNTGCIHKTPHKYYEHCIDGGRTGDDCPVCIPVPEVKEPKARDWYLEYLNAMQEPIHEEKGHLIKSTPIKKPEVTSVLLSDEEREKIRNNSNKADIVTDTLKAQHAKSVKAVFEELEKYISATYQCPEAGGLSHAITVSDWDNLKTQFGIDDGFRPTLKEAFDYHIKKQMLE